MKMRHADIIFHFEGVIRLYSKKHHLTDSLLFTVEPGNRNGLEETHSDDGASDSEFLQQLYHVGPTLSVTFHRCHLSSHVDNCRSQCVKNYLNFTENVISDN